MRAGLDDLDPYFYSSLTYTRNVDVEADPIRVDPWGGFVLKRTTPSGGGVDCSAPYPMFCIADPDAARAGLGDLRAAGMISFVGVLDPLRSGAEARQAFPFRRPFKTHYLINRPGIGYEPTPHHRAALRTAAKRCTTEAGPLGPWLSDWAGIYANTATNRGWSSAHRFGPAHWRDLADSGRVMAFRSVSEGEVAAMALFLQDGGLVYYHLAASTARGRTASAGYAIVNAAVEHYGDVEAIYLGGAPGGSDDASNGLAKFKAGFANGSGTAWLVGEVLDEARYRELGPADAAGYFPAYRAPVQTAGAT